MKLKLFMYLPLLLLFLFLVSTLCFPLARNPKGKGRQKFKLKPLGRLPPFARSNRYHRYHDSGDSGSKGGQRLKTQNLYLRPLLPLLLTNQGQKLSLPCGHGTKGRCGQKYKSKGQKNNMNNLDNLGYLFTKEYPSN